MKKKITLITAGVLCTVSMGLGAIASGLVHEITAQLRQDFTVKIDGQVKEFKNAQGETVYPILYDGTTYLPIRAIGELMGKTVYWYEDEKRIELRDEHTTVTDADVIIPSGSSNNISSDSVKANNASDKNKDSNHKNDNFIGKDKAKKIALNKAGITADGVVFEDFELDRDAGIYHYEIEFHKNGKEYEIDIKADDGTVLKWEEDRNR